MKATPMCLYFLEFYGCCFRLKSSLGAYCGPTYTFVLLGKDNFG